MQMGVTQARSENQGNQEPCEQSKASVNLAPTTALCLRVLSRVQVSSQTLPFAWEVGISLFTKRAAGKLNELLGEKLLHRACRCGMVHLFPCFACLSPFSEFCLGLGFVCFRQNPK